MATFQALEDRGAGAEAAKPASLLSFRSLGPSASMVSWAGSQETSQKGRRRPFKVSKPESPKLPLAPLACLNCRAKKVKCELEDGCCKRCTRMNLECSVPTDDDRRQPCSKKVIRELKEKIRGLEKALSAAQKSPRGSTIERDRPLLSSSSRGLHEEFKPTGMPEQSNNPLTMLARLCGGQWQLNRDAAGQLRCFGPTSSLHVTESVSSSILDWANIHGIRSVSQWQTVIPPDLQQDLLDLYWTYQHPVLQVVHKEAFLDGMRNQTTTYFSELLLCCILACAARMSDRPEVRTLVYVADDAGDDEAPFLSTTITGLLDVELRRPSITTVQSLLLLSVMDCARSNDTKGWLYCGNACRLAFDLGLHRDFQYLGSSVFTQYDLEIRQRVFWACFVFDRLWGLYLGRPHCVRLHDVTVPRLESNSDPDHQMAAAWANLLEIVGCISEILNGTDWVPIQITELDAELKSWLANLPPSLQYHARAPPTIHVLHLQYCSATILLHRSTAHFGTAGTSATISANSEAARNTCVAAACQIALILSDYQIHHGSASTMSGVALHTIATAATTLIANIVESRGSGGRASAKTMESQLMYLKQCMRTLGQLEKSYFVTSRVRKIIQLVIRLLNLDLGQQQLLLPVVSPPAIRPVPGLEIPHETETMQMPPQQTGADDDPGILPLELGDYPESTSPFRVEDFLFQTPTTQFDFLPFYESCYGKM